MIRSVFFSLVVASSTALVAQAQAQQPPAPIERPTYQASAAVHAGQSANVRPTRVLTPAPGVRVLTDGHISTVSNSGGHVELRLDHGRANVAVDQPADGTVILVDLPGGQADLVRDGFYTLNADTNTLAVLHGEAVAFPPNAPPEAQGKTVKEMQGAVLGQHIFPNDLYEAQAQADILAAPGADRGNNGSGDAYAQGPQGFAPGGYGDDFDGDYGYPVYYGYPYYPWGWNYAWGYPGWGFGWGWGGGYWGGYRGYRGGYGYHGIPHGGYAVHGGGVHSGFSGGGGFHGGGFGGGHAGGGHR